MLLVVTLSGRFSEKSDWIVLGKLGTLLPELNEERGECLIGPENRPATHYVLRVITLRFTTNKPDWEQRFKQVVNFLQNFRG